MDMRFPLKTPELKVARGWRDRHLLPMLQTAHDLEAVKPFAHSVLSASERLQSTFEDCLVNVKGEIDRGVTPRRGRREGDTLGRLVEDFN